MYDVQIRVWDAPLRVFHWLLAVSVTAAIATGWIGGNWIFWHGKIGLFVLGLLVFRLVWGLVGSSYARWSRILSAPFALPAYLKGTWHQAGHNPAGSLSVLAMLGLLAMQVVTGLGATDDIAFQGPLYGVVGSELSSELTNIHRLAKWLLVALIGLHILAIVLYKVLKGQSLVPAMITGTMPQEHPEQLPAVGGGLGMAILAVVCAGAVVWGVMQAESWFAPPPPAPSASSATPDW